MIRKLWYWLPPIALMVLIFIMSSRHSVQVSETFALNFIFFKSIHMIEYALLYFLLFRAIYSEKNKKISLQQKLIIPMIIAILYGMSDELHQRFVPTREGTVRDVFIDSIGILLMFLYTKYNLPQLKKLL